MDIKPLPVNIPAPKIVAPSPPVPTGTGFEKLLIILSVGIGTAETAIIDVAYGKPGSDGGIKFPGNRRKTNGILPILREINKIDLCNIINYTLGNINLTTGVLGEKLAKLNKAAKTILDLLEGSYLDPSQVKQPEKIALLIAYISELDALIDSEIFTLFPKIQLFKNNLNNVVGTLVEYNAAAASYEILRINGTDVDESTLQALRRAANRAEGAPPPTVSLADIPNAEVQKVMNTIRDVKDILHIIISITSVGDLASRLIPNEIQALQKIISPAQLLPFIRLILNAAKGFNQICQKILGYVNTARTIVRVVQILITVTKIAIFVFRLLPLPLMFATSGVMDGLVYARQILDDIVASAEKRVAQIGAFIDLVYAFCITVVSILEEIIALIEMLIFTLESCNSTNTSYNDSNSYKLPNNTSYGLETQTLTSGGTSGRGDVDTSGTGTGVGDGSDGTRGGSELPTSPIIRDLKDVRSQLQQSFDDINSLVSAYNTAKTKRTESTYNGYIIRIEEEAVEEDTIRNKRRRAVAYDYRNVMVLATDLTFATDLNILFEEARLRLINAGLVQDTGKITLGLDGLSQTLDLPESSNDVYSSIGINPTDGTTPADYLRNDLRAVQIKINTIISNMVGGQELQELVRGSVDPGNVLLKENLRLDRVDLTNNDPVTGGTSPTGQIPINTGGRSHTDYLSDREQARLEALVEKANTAPNAVVLIQTQTYREAIRKLDYNQRARMAL